MRTPHLVDDVAEVLVSEDQLRSKVAELGAQLSLDYAGRPLTLVSVLKGSLPFMADLMRAITIPLTIDLMEVSSYGGAVTETSGLVRILKDLSASIEGKDVVIVEDIIDTGLTLNYLMRYLRGKNPRSLRICALLDKPARRLVDIDIDYRGFSIPDRFVIGYGLDYGEYYRNLPFIGVLEPEVYSAAMRRGLGRGRLLVGIGRCSRSSARSCPGPSRAVRSGCPVMTQNAFDGAGILMFIAGRRAAGAADPALRIVQRTLEPRPMGELRASWPRRWSWARCSS